MSLSQAILVVLLALCQIAATPVTAPRPENEKKSTKADNKVEARKDQSGDPSAEMASKCRLVIVSPPTDIFTDGDPKTRVAHLVLRATEPNLGGPVLLSGELEDKDSHRNLPIDAFQLTTASALSDAAVTQAQLLLKQEWVAAGNYTGTLQIAAMGDTAGQDIKLNVSVRPSKAWWSGILFLAIGAGISWLAVVYAVRQRQMAGNQIFVARLAELLRNLRDKLNQVTAAGAPTPTRTLKHINQIIQQKLGQFLTDEELSVMAGVTVPPVGSVTLLDEIEGVNRVVQNGFGQLLELWNGPGPHRDPLTPFFGQMDVLGGKEQELPQVDQGIEKILADAQSAVSAYKTMAGPVTLPVLPTENAVVHRVVFTTQLLDILSYLTVVVLGVYILIWKNPGFGSAGNLLEAFFWGLGLKLGTDAARLGPSDVRATFGIKIPAGP
jgi:hypothetical protein